MFSKIELEFSIEPYSNRCISKLNGLNFLLKVFMSKMTEYSGKKNFGELIFFLMEIGGKAK
jgi:hypothetical protein